MTIDWQQQWALFAPNFKNGKAHIPLPNNTTLQLIPGAGFGDLSHPTTHLMLEMLKQQASGETIVDIGTGSGILALAALLIGANKAFAIDIDPEALLHTRTNARLNSLENKIQIGFSLPKKLPKSLFLMNMIFCEQKEFGPVQWNRFAKLWIVSGILEEQKKEYLKQVKEWGWTPHSEYQKGEWMGWIFRM